MWKKLYKKFNKNNQEYDLAPPSEEARASVLSNKMQNSVNALKPKIEISAVLVDRNKWSLTTIILSIVLLICAAGWYMADVRFANHVRVAFVKLDPSGEHNVSFYDENSKPTFFINTIASLLSHYTERRYSKVSFQIKEDYGFVINFMSPALKNAFLTDYHAAAIATVFETCKTCVQTKVRVRTIQNDESDLVILHGKSNAVYRSTVFTHVDSLNSDGTYLGSINQIITLTWTLKNITSLTNNLNAIKANPIGIEILAESIKTDPTPVTENIL